ncbi:MAG: T9SS type A sorting domain-containing protein [Bacteroidota bacterium]
MKKYVALFFFTISITLTLYSQSSLTTVVFPKYIEGANPTNTDRIPYAFRARLTGLLHNSTYRFYNQIVVSTDVSTANGAGNCIFTSATGGFVRTSGPSLATAGNYGTFTTDGTGTYEGWFITEPTGNKRFIPGNYVFMRITLNDGAGGTSAALLLTTADSVRVVKLGTAVSDSTGTGLRCTSSASPKNFVFAYADTAGTGRPISGSFIESDGTDNSTTTSYAAFYSNSVNGVNGSFGIVLPNMLSNGIRRIEQRSLADGTLVASATDIDGIWPSGANTINPSGGTTEIILNGTDIHETGVQGRCTTPGEFALMQNYPNPFNPSTEITYTLKSGGIVSLSVYDLLGREVAVLVNNEKKIAGEYEVSFNAVNFPSGVYFYKLQTESYTATKRMVLIK